MATADEYAGWIVANQAKKGTPEFDTVARAYQEVKGAPKSAAQRAAETNAQVASGKPVVSDADREMANPANSGSTLDNVRAGAGKAFVDLSRGVRQIFTPEKRSLSGLITGDNRSDIQKEIDESRKLDAPLMDTKAGLAGNIAGNVAATAPTMFIPGANGIIGGAALGSTLGAAQPVATGESRLNNAVVGGIGGAAVPAAAATWRTGKSLVEPLYAGGRENIIGRTLTRAAGPNAQAVEGRLANAAELVPGSAPTAAEVAESGGIAALQRAASAADPEAYAQRGLAQSAARAQALRDIAGTPGDLANAKGVREMMSGPHYDAAMKAKVPLTVSDKKISEIMSRPSLEGAWQEAEKMAREAGITSVTAKGEMTGETLHYLKMALDQKIADSKPGSPAQRLLMGTRDELRNWMEKAIPEYKAGREAFKSWSPAVDQHKVGAYLADKLSPALADQGALGRETAAQYAQALRNAPGTLKATTGFRGNDLADVMAPNQMNVLENVGRDLGRKANAQDLGRGAGSDTFQKLSMANIGQQSGMPRLVDFASSLPGVSRATSWIYRDTDNQIRQQMAQALLDPKKSAQLMREAKGNPQLAKALQEVQRLMIPAGASTALASQQ